MRHAPLLLGVLFTFPLTASVACSAKTTDTSPTAGWSRSISVGPRSALPYALGEIARISVDDELYGPQECTGSEGGCGVSQQSCSSPHAANDSTVESVRCDGACEVTVTRKTERAGSFDLQVLAREAGTATVVLRLRDPGGDVKETVTPIEFRRASHVNVERRLGSSPHGTAYAALPGAWFTWCATLDDHGTPLAYEAENIHVSITGAGSAAPRADEGPLPASGRCVSFVAQKPGDIDVALSHGALVRHEKVRVVDVADVKAVELVQLGSDFEGYGQPAPIEEDPIRALRAAVGIAIADECLGKAVPVVQRLTLWDGSRALGPATALTVTPRELLSLGTVGLPVERATVAQLDAKARGTGSIASNVGAAHAELPIVVAGGSCLDGEVDAGALDGANDGTNDDAADAGAPSKLEDASAAAP